MGEEGKDRDCTVSACSGILPTHTFKLDIDYSASGLVSLRGGESVSACLAFWPSIVATCLPGCANLLPTLGRWVGLHCAGMLRCVCDGDSGEMWKSEHGAAWSEVELG
jgi:hypothetical protein